MLSRVCLFATLLVVHAAATASAQTGQVVGTVVDPSGAPVASVVVVMRDTARDVAFQSTTDGSGRFTFLQVSPSTYSLEAIADNFAPARRSVQVAVADSLAIVLRLALPSVSETVAVESEPPRSRPGFVGLYVDQEVIQRSPLNGRSFQQLITMAPGVVATDANSGGQFSANGQRPSANYVTIDGVSGGTGINTTGIAAAHSGAGTSVGYSATGTTQGLVAIDAVQEFKVQTSTYAPEYGRAPGAQVTIVTKSGGDVVHGSAFEFFRDDALNASSYFTEATGQPKPELSLNDFGATLGGPLWRTSASRAYVFGSYEGQRIAQPRTRITQVPSLAAREQAPASLRALLNAYPRPNGRDSAGGYSEFIASYSDSARSNATSVRVDVHVLGLRGFARVVSSRSSDEARGANSSGTSLAVVGTERIGADGVTIGLDGLLRNRFVVDSRFNLTASRGESDRVLTDFGEAVPFALATLRPDFARSASGTTAYNFGSGILGGVLIGGNVGRADQRHMNLTSSVATTAGSHTFKGGVDVRWIRTGNAPGLYTVSAVFPAPASAINPTAFTVRRRDETIPEYLNIGVYAQDEYRLREKLTVSYGVRWDVDPAPATSSRETAPIPIDGVDRFPNLSLLPQGTALWRTAYSAVAPRVSAALSITPTLTLSSGGGVFFDTGQGVSAAVFGGSWPYQVDVTQTGRTLPIADGSVPLPVADLTSPRNGTAWSFERDRPAPRTYHWNAGLERTFASTVVAARVVGAEGRRLPRVQRLDMRRVNENFRDVNLVTGDGRSRYLALLGSATVRAGNAARLDVNYTLSRSRDTESSETALLPPDQFLPASTDWAESDYDRRHAFKTFATVDLEPLTSGVLRTLVGGTQLTTLVTALSGLPWTPFVTRDLGFGSYRFRPDLNSGVDPQVDAPNAAGGIRYDRNAFVVPTELRQGQLARNAFRGPALVQVDAGIERRLNLGTRTVLSVRCDVFNVLNRSNFGLPVASLTDPRFGELVSLFAESVAGVGPGTGLLPLLQLGGPRAAQLSLRIAF